MNVYTSKLTSPCQVSLPGVCVFLKGGQKSFLGTSCRGVNIGKHREMTTCVAILLHLCFVKFAVRSLHLLHPSEAKQPFCLATVARILHVVGYRHRGNGDG